jgi:hypothetical protein
MSAPSDRLPYVDEHSMLVSATPATTWGAALHVVDARLRGAGGTARLLGCADTAVGGPRPLDVGSTLPGFHVEIAEPERQLTLAGRHRFSDYALILRFEDRRGTTLVRAATRASFPGLKGHAYRALVIGTRIHILVTRRLLRGVRHRAERA